MVVIELDGCQHLKVENKADDIIRDSYLKDMGFYVLRYSNGDVLEDTDRVVDEIDNCLCKEVMLIVIAISLATIIVILMRIETHLVSLKRT